jgi:hypothetical protein
MLPMKLLRKLLHRFTKIIVDNYLLSLFIIIICVVGFVAVLKLSKSENKFIYAEVKISQGLWWVNVAKPAIWMIESIHPGDREVDGRGNFISQIDEIRYYPATNDNLYDVYLLLKIKANFDETTSKYTFKRAVIGTGSPIELELPNLQVSGNVMRLSKKPIRNKLLDKEITISKKFTYPYEYNVIEVGDSYFDGKEKVFEVVDKLITDTYLVYSGDGNNYPIEAETIKDITLKVKVKLEVKNGIYIYGKDQIVRSGKSLDISTPNFKYEDYKIVSIN